MRWWIVVLVAIALLVGGWFVREHLREARWSLAYAQATSWIDYFNYPPAEKALLDILPETEQWWPNSQRLVSTLSLLGTTYQLERRMDEAESTFNRALKLSIGLPNHGGVELGRIELGLAIVARDQSRYSESERLFTEALAILRADPAAARRDDAVAMGNLGYLAAAEGRYDEAEAWLSQSVGRYRQVLGSTPHPDLANAYYQLAQAFLFDARYADAAEQYQLSIDVYKKLVGDSSLEVGYSLWGLAEAKEQLGETAEAHELMERAQNIIRMRSGSTTSPDAVMITWLAALAVRQGKYAEAEDFYKRAITAYEQAGRTAELANALQNLGCLYRDHDEFAMNKAEPLLQRALSLREAAFGPDHALTASSLSDLALYYFYEKKFSLAKDYGIRALATEEKLSGPESLPVSLTLNRVGLAERDLGELQPAEQNLRRALAIREKLLATNHVWIATSLENLASVYLMEGQERKATPLLVRARQIRANNPMQ